MSRFNSGLSVLKEKKNKTFNTNGIFLKKETKLCFVFVNVYLLQHFATMANRLFAEFKQSCHEQFLRDLFFRKHQLSVFEYTQITGLLQILTVVQ